MDQPAGPDRYSACNRMTRPDAAGAAHSEDAEGLHAARPDGIPAALSRENSSGAGRRPRFVLPRIPRWGEESAAGSPTIRLREPDAWAAETDGAQLERAADGPPAFLVRPRNG